MHVKECNYKGTSECRVLKVLSNEPPGKYKGLIFKKGKKKKASHKAEGVSKCFQKPTSKYKWVKPTNIQSNYLFIYLFIGERREGGREEERKGIHMEIRRQL